MQIRTLSVSLAAPREAVFNFLADIENLPRWATGFCERLDLRSHGWSALTMQGELVVELEACARTGVIDLRTGPTIEQLTPLPLRVLALSPRRTLVTLTLVEAPDLPREYFETRYAVLMTDAERLRKRFGGGEVHAGPASGGVPALAELGVN